MKELLNLRNVNMQNILIITLPFFLLGTFLGWIFRLIYSKTQLSSIESRAKEIDKHAGELIKSAELHSKELIKSAKLESENIKKQKILEFREQLQRERSKQEEDIKLQRQEVQAIEKRVIRREEFLDEKQIAQERKEQSLNGRKKHLDDTYENLKKREKLVQKELEEVAQMSQDEARRIMFANLEEKLKKERQEYVNKVEQETYHFAEKKSKEILVSVMQRIASEVSSEFTTLTVDLPSEEMKGRIIGKEGRNVKSFEVMTGVNLIIGDAPDSVGISCFDPVRREIARQALERLVSDGRINPGKIEETVKRVSNDIEQFMFDQGERVLYDLKMRIKPDAIKLFGSMYFRTSYGQNMLFHTKEVILIAEMIARELGANVDVVKRGALFHDIGKAIDTNSGISHVEIGIDIAKKLNEDPDVINAIAAHHGEVPYSCIESVIVQIADTISASRPGARREVLETYIRRLEQFEKIAKSFEGVEKSYAIQAGRELRILVDHNKVNDNEAKDIARKIAEKIENEVKYPGYIKITMIRETRIVEYAK